jgi:hypothetical protein
LSLLLPNYQIGKISIDKQQFGKTMETVVPCSSLDNATFIEVLKKFVIINWVGIMYSPKTFSFMDSSSSPIRARTYPQLQTVSSDILQLWLISWDRYARCISLFIAIEKAS